MSVCDGRTEAEDDVHQQELWLTNPGMSFSEQDGGAMFESQPEGDKNYPQPMFDVDDYSAAQLLRFADSNKMKEMELQYYDELLLRTLKLKMETGQLRRKLDETRHIEAKSLGLNNLAFNQDVAYQGDREQTAEEDDSWVSCDSAGVSNMDDYATSLPGYLAGLPELVAKNTRRGRNRGMPSSLDSWEQEELIRDLLELYNLYDQGEDDISSVPISSRRFKGRNVRSSPSHLKRANQISNIELFKTEMCRSWTEFGMCPYGTICRFAHGYEELRSRPKPHKYKTEKCKKFLAGYCPYGSRCCFVHNPSEQQRTLGYTKQDEKFPGKNRVTRRRWRPTPIHQRKRLLQI